MMKSLIALVTSVKFAKISLSVRTVFYPNE